MQKDDDHHDYGDPNPPKGNVLANAPEGFPEPRVGLPRFPGGKPLSKSEAPAVSTASPFTEKGWDRVHGPTPPPLNKWLRTWRRGEHGENVCLMRGGPGEAEWVDRYGRTTVTHSTFLPPTHWCELGSTVPGYPGEEFPAPLPLVNHNDLDRTQAVKLVAMALCNFLFGFGAWSKLGPDQQDGFVRDAATWLEKSRREMGGDAG